MEQLKKTPRILRIKEKLFERIDINDTSQKSPLTASIHEFDSNNNLLSMRDPIGLFTYSYAYDSLGRIIMKVVSHNSRIDSRNVFSHDKRGNLVEELKYNKDGELMDTIKCKYDVNDYLVKKSKVSQVYIIEEHFINDSKGRLLESRIEQEYIGRHGIKTYEPESVFYKYDEFGNMVEKTRKKVNGTEERTEYKYDEYGNWIIHFKRRLLTERSIEYQRK